MGQDFVWRPDNKSLFYKDHDSGQHAFYFMATIFDIKYLCMFLYS